MDIRCAGAIIADEAGRILVIRRGRPPGVGLWSIPGGRVEPGESLVDAVRREVREETGLDVEVGAPAGDVVLPAIDPADRFLVTDFHARVTPGTSTVPRPGDDASDARWVDREQFLGLELTAGLASTLERWGVFGDQAR